MGEDEGAALRLNASGGRELLAIRRSFGEDCLDAEGTSALRLEAGTK
jgi:hypothetical protein